MILAAGLGTRLLPLTANVSKVVLPLAGIPVLVRVFRFLRGYGVEDFVVNLHHTPDAVRLLSVWLRGKGRCRGGARVPARASWTMCLDACGVSSVEGNRITFSRRGRVGVSVFGAIVREGFQRSAC